jgi:uncharacterized protein (DUF302 family)
MRMAIMAAGMTAAAGMAMAQDAHVSVYDGSFEDAAFELEQAITAQGLVIDYVSHVGDMLNRTGQDVGSDVTIFDRADIYLFCSAVVSRQVMEADPANIVHCPYGIYVAERDGEVTLGYRDYPDGPMDAVEDLLGGIVTELTGG